MNIEFNKMQKLLSEIIEREMKVEFEYDFKFMEEEQAKEHNEITNRLMQLYEMLDCKLDEEEMELFKEFIDLRDKSMLMEIWYYFERGVRSGLSSLSYLKEYFHVF
ncbi:hypothetical protein CJD_A0012 [Clostridium perfringens D str. JGS1721]|uniref:Uncharacterized protein n=2 Tax=Clostridium perfringens D str. JGS1721 TaxID=488537 RepID=B1V831_CLOPF|nr:DUF6809 family protein [Clostridium perfringens]EDT70030.1 hypothetical protein CJD_A0012 [Clostridium perfringens D str. JGS1721]